MSQKIKCIWTDFNAQLGDRRVAISSRNAERFQRAGEPFVEGEQVVLYEKDEEDAKPCYMNVKATLHWDPDLKFWVGHCGENRYQWTEVAEFEKALRENITASARI